MTAEFDAKSARGKRPCPIWVDAFHRDTQMLQTDEIGAYFLLIMAMWSRRGCDLPDDDRILARVSRVSLRLWKSRIGPAMRQFMTADDGVVFFKKLREEATYAERQVTNQSNRRKDEKSSKSLIPNDTNETADKPRINRGGIQPNYPTTQHRESMSDDIDSNAGVKPKQKRMIDNFPDYVDEETRKAFIEHRRLKRSPVTERVLAILSKNLDEIRDRGMDPIAAIDLAIERGWMTVKPDWAEKELMRPEGGRNGRGRPVSRRQEHNEERVDGVLALAQRRDAERSRGDPEQTRERDVDGGEDHDASPPLLRH